MLVAPPGTWREHLQRLFEAKTYRVVSVDTAAHARSALAMSVFEVVVFAAPDATAAVEIGRLCDATTTPVVVLTASSGDADLVRALDAGAADAIAYPHSQDELLARLRLVLRTRRSPAIRRATRFGELAVGPDAGVVQLSGQPLDLAPIEYRLLVKLMQARGRIVPRDDLLRQIWGDVQPGRLNGLRVAVARLRRKLELHADAAIVIVSLSGVGYRLAVHEDER